MENAPKVLDVNWNETPAKDKIACFQEFEKVPIVRIRITEQKRDNRKSVSTKLASFVDKIQFYKNRGEVIQLQQQKQASTIMPAKKQSMLRARAKSMYRPSEERPVVQMRPPPRRPSDPQMIPAPTIPQHSITTGMPIRRQQNHLDHSYTVHTHVPHVVIQRPYTNPSCRATIMTAIGEGARQLALMPRTLMENQMPAALQSSILTPPAKQTLIVNNSNNAQTRNLKVLSVDILNSRVAANNVARDLSGIVVSTMAQEVRPTAAPLLAPVLETMRNTLPSIQAHAPLTGLTMAPSQLRVASQVQASSLSTQAQPQAAAAPLENAPIPPRNFGSTGHVRCKITPMRPRPHDIDDDTDEPISVSLTRLPTGAVELSLKSNSNQVQYEQLSELRKGEVQNCLIRDNIWKQMLHHLCKPEAVVTQQTLDLFAKILPPFEQTIFFSQIEAAKKHRAT